MGCINQMDASLYKEYSLQYMHSCDWASVLCVLRKKWSCLLSSMLLGQRIECACSQQSLADF